VIENGTAVAGVGVKRSPLRKLATDDSTCKHITEVIDYG